MGAQKCVIAYLYGMFLELVERTLQHSGIERFLENELFFLGLNNFKIVGYKSYYYDQHCTSNIQTRINVCTLSISSMAVLVYGQLKYICALKQITAFQFEDEGMIYFFVELF